jgi:hypothetical protein
MRRIIVSIEMVRGELRIDMDESSTGEQPDEIAIQAALNKVIGGVLRHFEKSFAQAAGATGLVGLNGKELTQ